jgi:hypothetical protein
MYGLNYEHWGSGLGVHGLGVHVLEFMGLEFMVLEFMGIGCWREVEMHGYSWC